MQIGLSPYSFPWRSGGAGRNTPRVCATPLSAYDLLDLAAQHGLSSVELPLPMLPDYAPETLAAWRGPSPALLRRCVEQDEQGEEHVGHAGAQLCVTQGLQHRMQVCGDAGA